MSDIPEKYKGAKLLCKGTDEEVMRWAMNNRPTAVSDHCFYSALVEMPDGTMQKAVWYSAKEMEAALKELEALHA